MNTKLPKLLAPLLFFLAMTCVAQLTLNYGASSSGVSFGRASDDIRIVDGKAYPKSSSQWDLYSCIFQKQIGGDAIVNDVLEFHSATTPRTKRPFYIRHFMPDSPPITGHPNSFRAMNLGTTNIEGELMEMLDCGVVVTNAVTATTNAPANKPPTEKQPH